MGFAFSILLTVAAYLVVSEGILAGSAKVAVLVGLGFVQLLVQLVFFLHLDRRSSRWNLWILLSIVGVVLILVFGTIWIMNNLDYHMGTPAQVDSFLIKDEGLQK
jgi:cytochrome o ubiquinol oxidase operon protein cyoD